MKLWTVEPLDKEQAAKIQNEYDLPAIIAMLLQIRGITSKDEIQDFLFNDSEIDSPYEIKDMDRAVERIRRAIDNCELICVYGDYDADGVTSTALMYSYLDAVGANAMYYIPSRETEGYGMNKTAVKSLKDRGVRLIVTVDNGIAAVDEIAYANSLGIDTVVTDHHMPTGALPDACAVVDLHRDDCKSRFKSLSGVGVAFKVIMALEGEYCDTDALLDNYADLLCIGTVGDIVELRGENRVFVKRGLKSIMNTDRAGIDALVKNSGLGGKNISAGNVSFTLVPRINAAGRLGLSQKSVELLLTEDFEEANEIASELCGENSRRQQIEKEILDKIDLQIKSNPSLAADKILVIDGENWHQGVIGIVASKIREDYGKPAVIISRMGESAKGSGRSVEGFPLCDAVFACSDILTHYGGHPMAVGLSLASKDIERFRISINRFADEFGEMPFDKLRIECKLNPAYLSVDMVASLSYLQPFGAGNSTPIFGLYNMKLDNIIPLSNNKHLKLLFSRGSSTVNALKFFTSSEEFPYSRGDMLDLAVTLDTNEYNGNVSVSVIIKDIKPSGFDMKASAESLRNYEAFVRNDDLEKDAAKDLLPNREDFALLYRFLRSSSGFNYSVETLCFKLDNKISCGKIKVILDAMSQLGLIEMNEGIGGIKISLSEVGGKVDLNSAPAIKKLRSGYCE
ncbi:MAG: single-stranded-DNA-specific exonuclease RecJ [Clostridiales bacterium]|nr:single-stranded-DNA-specific exonuclease RecJ [Clostridiales bacterium]